MAGIVIHPEKISDAQALTALCPFGALCCTPDGRLEITEACRMCKICVRKGPEGVFEYREDVLSPVDKQAWRGIAVYAEQFHGQLHPVTFELIGKARSMAERTQQPVYALLIGQDVAALTETLLAYGVDCVVLYEDETLRHFTVEGYTAALQDFIEAYKPSIVLVGGTQSGRSLAPRAAARVRTGLTADCTLLDVSDSGDLEQIRPAFGGNIMAHIRTPYHRPQFATVRYKVFSSGSRVATPTGRVERRSLPPEKLQLRTQVLQTQPKPPVRTIEDADVIIAAGRGLRRQKDLQWIEELAACLNAQIAVTRPLIEAGWADPRTQIGLSGRTVKPRLIITCGISGAVQFVSGMKGAECIVAINTDPQAPIFNVAHYALMGDLYEVLPALIQRLRALPTHTGG
ncbi:MAG: electron transfer flavoprotein subunit alpha/FixB family protein [Longilinea sp.]|nr:electron transfer flavoprotein subunit alpha/FixB family protein [Longilinea sp.]